MARFPFHKTLEQFDFAFQPSVEKRRLQELASLRFVASGENVLLLGPPGVGKTHLSIALGIKALEAGLSTSFISVPELIDWITQDTQRGQLAKRMQQLCKPKRAVHRPGPGDGAVRSTVASFEYYQHPRAELSAQRKTTIRLVPWHRCAPRAGDIVSARERRTSVDSAMTSRTKRR